MILLGLVQEVMKLEKENIASESENSSAMQERANQSGRACYEIIREEYLHSFQRSDKLDNKVYITLTFLGLFFLYIIDFFTVIPKIKFPNNIQNFILVGAYIIISIGLLVGLLYILSKLLVLLKPMEIQRLSPKWFVENNMQHQKEETVYVFSFTKCAACIEENNQKMEQRFAIYNTCVDYIKWLVIAAFLLQFIQVFINIS